MTSATLSTSPVGHEHLDLHLRHEVDRVLRAAVGLGVAALAAEALHLADRQALHARALQRLLHREELVRLDDGGDEAQHGREPTGQPRRTGRRVVGAQPLEQVAARAHGADGQRQRVDRRRRRRSMWTSRALRPGRPPASRPGPGRRGTPPRRSGRAGPPSGGPRPAAATPTGRRGAARRRRRGRAAGSTWPRPGAAGPRPAPAGPPRRPGPGSSPPGRRWPQRAAARRPRGGGAAGSPAAQLVAPGFLGRPAHEDDIHGGDRTERTVSRLFRPCEAFASGISARSETARSICTYAAAHGSPVAPRPPRFGVPVLGVLEEGAAGRGDGRPTRSTSPRAGPSASKAASGARRSSSSTATPRSVATAEGRHARPRRLRRGARPPRPRPAHGHGHGRHGPQGARHRRP